MNIDLKDMLKAGLHFGHKTSRWSPNMRPYIWGSKNHVHLIDISKTAFLLEKTGLELKKLAAEGGTFLWIGTKKPAQKIVQEIATKLNMPWVIHRWIGGTLSNFDQVKKAITRLLHLRDVMAKPTAHYTKKELVMIQKEIERLEKNVGGIIELSYPPAGLIVVDAGREQSAIKEASRLGIPIVSLVDTNTDPSGVNFVIPANDDSPKSIRYVLEYLQAKVEEGMKEFKDNKGAEKTAKKVVAKEVAPVVEPVIIEALALEEGDDIVGNTAKVEAIKKPLSRSPIKK
ncbi:30S ribosomal protein S2 [Candidatus Babeliales bacterium]|nr:30S ribosomal protein S2 [Candidatus Babeliales bacterium]